MDDEPSPTPERPRRLFFDDLADDPEADDPEADDSEADDSEADRPISRGRRRSEDDPTSDTGPIEPVRDPVAVGRQLFLDDAPDEPNEPPPVAGTRSPQPPPPRRRPLGAVLAVIGVLILIAVIASVEAQGGGKNHPVRAASHRASPSSHHSAVRSAATHPPRRSPSHAPTVARRTHRPTPTHATQGVPVKAPLTVLNNTTVTGLAGRAATLFSAHGWSVSVVGNYTGLVPATTVYYDPASASSRRAAQTLAAQFPQIVNVAPRFAGLPGAGLTVVLAPDWR